MAILSRRVLIPLALSLLGAALTASEPFASVEERLLRPTVGDPAFTVVSDTSSALDEGTRRSLEYSTGRSTAIRLGIVLEGGDRIEGAGWYDHQTAESTVDSPTSFSSIMDILYPAPNAFGVERRGTATAAGELRAWTLDVDYAHPFAGVVAPWSAEVSLGLRRAGLRDDFAGEWSGPTMTTRRVELISDAIGTGARVAGSVRRGFLDQRIGLSAAVGYALLRGRVATTSVAERIATAIDEREEGSEAGAFAMLDVSLGLDARLGAGFTLGAAYRLERWDGLLRQDLFVSSVQGQRSVERPTAMWDGFVLSLGWTAPP